MPFPHVPSIHPPWAFNFAANTLRMGQTGASSPSRRNTLVLGNETLLQITNMAPKIGGIVCSVEMWAKRIEQKWPERIGNVNLAMTQSRTNGFLLGASVSGETSLEACCPE